MAHRFFVSMVSEVWDSVVTGLRMRDGSYLNGKVVDPPSVILGSSDREI
jgi:hypothetical protein